MSTDSTSKTINVYGCGGCGINIVSTFLRHNGKKEFGFAEFKTFFLDTSRANHVAENDAATTYLIEGLDGSGKKRDSNYRIISEKAKEMLHRFKPGDINIVVHSASGGSGSVIGPTLVSELLSREVPTIVIMIGSSDSRIEAMNTVNTLKSYEVIAQKREMPVISIYYENTKATPRGEVDARIQVLVVLLSAIFSGQNRELDTADLNNFLNYPRVTSFSPKLSYLDFFTGKIEVGKNQTVISVVTLTDSTTDSSPNIDVEYQAVGFIGDKAKDAVKLGLPIHMTAISGFFHDTIARLNERIASIDETRGACVEKSIIQGNIESTNEGLVL